jgi:hypothetical protein
MQAKTLRINLEVLLLTGVAVGIGFYYNPQDPLFVDSRFPWFWFIPVLIALKYGRLASYLALAVIFAAVFYVLRTTLFSWESFELWILGGVTLTFICSEYHAIWQSRQIGLFNQQAYLNKRLESLSRAYLVMRISHDRLEEALVIKPATLRDAFVKLRAILAVNKGVIDEKIALQYLNVLSYYAPFDQASLYLKEGARWIKESVAHVGEREELNLKDMLLTRCLNKKKATYLAINSLDKNEVSDYLAVVPMQTAEDRIIGVLTISKLPFLYLNDETLKTLTLMLAYIADEVWATQKAQEVQRIFPSCPAFFASEILKLKHLDSLYQIDSSVITFYLRPDPQRVDIETIIRQEIRSLDILWFVDEPDMRVILILMPLTEVTMLHGYLERIEKILKQHHISLGREPFTYQYRQLSNYQDVNVLLEELIMHAEI